MLVIRKPSYSNDLNMLDSFATAEWSYRHSEKHLKLKHVSIGKTTL